MYKIIENNQIIDVIDNIQFVKCLPQSQKLIAVDKRQANGIVSSDGDTVYHILGTPNTSNDFKHSVTYAEIEEEEYLKLTTQMKENYTLEKKVKELEQMILSLKQIIEGR